jgi:hypothetical protein
MKHGLPSQVRAIAVAIAAISGFAPGARADDDVLWNPSSPDVATSHDDPLRHQIDRTWLYVDDARIAPPMVVVALTNLSYTDAGSSPTRIASPYPSVYNSFAGNTAQPGGLIGVGAEVGLLPRVSIAALGQMGLGGMGPSPNAGVVAGLRVQLLPLSWRTLHVVASGGYLREAWQGPVYDDDTGKWLPGAPNGDNGAWLQVAVSGDIQRLRLAGTLHGEPVFSNGRDPVDLMVEAGAAYRLFAGLRAGVEYVGQDLEESINPGAEGGARHFIGPTASWQLLGDRLTVAAGPAFGLSDLSPRVRVRMALAYGF